MKRKKEKKIMENKCQGSEKMYQRVIHHNYQSNSRNKKNIQIFPKLRKHTKYIYINNIPQNEVYESVNCELVEYL